MATEADLLAILDEDQSPAPIAPAVDVEPDAPVTRDDLIAMLDSGEATIEPPRPSRARGTADVTPLNPPPTEPTPPSVAPGDLAMREQLGVGQPFPLEKRAAQAGVLFDKPAPRGHALASLAINDDERLHAYQVSLREHFGQDVRVEIGPETGAIEYLDPDTGRFALAAPPRKGAMNSVTGALGGTIVAVPELVGGALGLFATKWPTAVTAAGGAGGAVVGEVARIELGRALGINQKASAQDVAKAALSTGTGSAVVGVGFDQTVRLVQALRNAYKGDFVRFAKRAEKLGVDAEEAAAIQSQVNDALAAERMRISARNADLPPRLQKDLPREHQFTLTLGEASGSPELLAAQDAIKRSQSFQARFGEFDADRQRALRDYYDLLAQSFSRNSIGEREAFEGARDVAATRLHFAEQRANEHMARYQADAHNALESVDTMPAWQVGDIGRQVGERESAAFRDRAETLANNLRTVAGGARFIENTNLSATLKQLDDETRNIIFANIREGRRQARRIPSPTIEGADGAVIDHPLFNPESRWSFDQSWDTLSELKRIVREKSEGTVTESTDIGAMQQLIGAMEKDLFDAASKTELGPVYRDFTRWYRRERTRLNQGTVGELMRREGGSGGRFVIASEEAFKSVFPDVGPKGGFGLRRTREFMDLIKNDPQAIQSFRQAIADDWRRFVRDPETGRLNPEKHREWLRNHSEQLNLKFPGLAPEERAVSGRDFDIVEPLNSGEPLLTLQERRAFQRGSGVEEALQAREVARDKALEAINKTFDAKLANLDNMGQVMTLIGKDLDGRNARELVRMLNNPATLDVLRGVRGAYLNDMREKVMTARLPATQERVLNGDGLRRFLFGRSDTGERGQIAVVRELFGNEYANGLTTVEKALTAASRETSFPNRSNTAFWQVGKMLARMKFGVISREALIVSSTQRLFRTAADAVFTKAIMNPADMKRLQSIWTADIRKRKAAIILGRFGMAVTDSDVAPQE